MKSLWIWLFVCSFLISVSVGDECKKQSACSCTLGNGSTIDLTTIGRKEHPRFFEVVAGVDNASRFSYDPCYPFSYPANYHDIEVDSKPCLNVAVCTVEAGSDDGHLPKEKSLGSHDTADFFMIEDQVYINYTFDTSGGKKQFTVHLVCDDSIEQYLNEIEEYSVVLTSKCACLDNCQEPKPDTPETPAKKKLSTGSILLITFFVIILVYIGIGILWNFCNGAQGVELLPNVEFWSDLPKLIAEGCVFTCSCFGRRQSYADM